MGRLILFFLITICLHGTEIIIDSELNKDDELFIKNVFFKDYQIKDDYIIPAMVKIRKGNYNIGGLKEKDEQPVKQIEIKENFYMSKFEITIGEYLLFVRDTNANKPEWLKKGSKFNVFTGSNEYYQKMCLDKDCPIIGITWNDANEYAKWMSKKTGRKFTLPSETQWEYSLKANKSSDYSFGDDSYFSSMFSWHKNNSTLKTRKVGQKRPNDFGLFDMNGNVAEWCSDWYTTSYKDTPTTEESYNKKTKYKVLRGGSWKDYPQSFYISNRNKYKPEYASNFIGFRLVCSES